MLRNVTKLCKLELRNRYLISIRLRKLIWYCSGAEESRSSQYLHSLFLRRRNIYKHPILDGLI